MSDRPAGPSSPPALTDDFCFRGGQPKENKVCKVARRAAGWLPVVRSPASSETCSQVHTDAGGGVGFLPLLF